MSVIYRDTKTWLTNEARQCLNGSARWPLLTLRVTASIRQHRAPMSQVPSRIFHIAILNIYTIPWNIVIAKQTLPKSA